MTMSNVPLSALVKLGFEVVFSFSQSKSWKPYLLLIELALPAKSAATFAPDEAAVS